MTKAAWPSHVPVVTSAVNLDATSARVVPAPSEVRRSVVFAGTADSTEPRFRPADLRHRLASERAALMRDADFVVVALPVARAAQAAPVGRAALRPRRALRD